MQSPVSLRWLRESRRPCAWQSDTRTGLARRDPPATWRLLAAPVFELRRRAVESLFRHWARWHPGRNTSTKPLSRQVPRPTRPARPIPWPRRRMQTLEKIALSFLHELQKHGTELREICRGRTRAEL